jgi:transcription elongation GreA/GreB family factor
VELEVEGREVSVITPESPVGAALMDQKQGGTYSFRAGSVGKILGVK